MNIHDSEADIIYYISEIWIVQKNPLNNQNTDHVHINKAGVKARPFQKFFFKQYKWTKIAWAQLGVWLGQTWCYTATKPGLRRMWEYWEFKASLLQDPV